MGREKEEKAPSETESVGNITKGKREKRYLIARRGANFQSGQSQANRTNPRARKAASQSQIEDTMAAVAAAAMLVMGRDDGGHEYSSQKNTKPSMYVIHNLSFIFSCISIDSAGFIEAYQTLFLSFPPLLNMPKMLPLRFGFFLVFSVFACFLLFETSIFVSFFEDVD